MGFIAVEDVCEFKKGDVVPEALGKVWFSMYKFPPVKKTEFVSECGASHVPETKFRKRRKSKKHSE